MIALDTNVLVRYLVKDDRKQWESAKALVDEALAGDVSVFVGQIVLCELAWVLASVYGYRRDAVRETLRAVASSGNIVVEQVDQVHRALEAHSAGKGDLADYLIRERALDSGCDEVATFDLAIARERGFRAM